MDHRDAIGGSVCKATASTTFQDHDDRLGNMTRSHGGVDLIHE
jgi:hypothetical protein